MTNTNKPAQVQVLELGHDINVAWQESDRVVGQIQSF